MTIEHCARAVSWLCIAAIVVLSLVPGSVRPHIAESGSLEHVVAYGGTGFFLAISYHALRTRLLFLGGLSVLSGLVEIAQLWIPERNSDVVDMLASVTGASVGLLIGALIVLLLGRVREMR